LAKIVRQSSFIGTTTQPAGRAASSALSSLPKGGPLDALPLDLDH
jgi:hypothetical protein